MDPRERNKRSSENQQSKLKKREETAQNDQQISELNPKQLRALLSNKNSDYVFRLQKELETQGKMEAGAAAAAVDQLLQEIITAQRKGITANNLFHASPKMKADQILHPVQKPQKTPYWQRLIDGILIYVAIMTGLFGVLALIQTPKANQSSQMGIVSLVLVGGLLGAVMTKYNDLLAPDAPKKGRGIKLVLYGVAIFAGLMVIMWVFQNKALAVINPVLPAGADIAIAAIVYLVRFAFRRYYKITGSPFYPEGSRPQAK